jgi:hypothetical protein
MSIKQTNSHRHSSSITRPASGRYTLKDDKSNIQIRASNGVLFKKSQKLIQSLKHKRQIAPDKLKLMRHVFTTISNSQSSKI